MGCGGSKNDVATGNLLTRRNSHRGSSSAGRRNRASSASNANDGAAGMPSKKQAIVNDQAQGGASLAFAKDSSEEYLSSRREMSFELAAAGSEGAEYFSVNGDAEVASAAGEDIQEEKASEWGEEAALAADVDRMKHAALA